ncbi:MAG: MFS transporter [Candidatus Thermoplasmatota archaeon]|nr:MFS transporter [Candidatus Thermoplasmatota archaeon]
MDRRLWILSITRFIRSFGRGSTFVFLPLIFIITYHISFIDTGLLLGSATVIMAVVQYYAGIFTDKIGRRSILVYSQIPAVVFYILIYYTVAFPFYFVLLVLSWYGTIVINSIQYPAVQASVADITSVSDRLSGYTIMRIMANLGIAIGPLLGAYLAGYGLQYIFLISAFATVAEIVMLYLLMRETYFPQKSSIMKKGELRKSYSGDRFFVVFIIIGIILGFFTRQRGSSLTVYSVAIENLPFMYLGYVWALNGFLVVLLQFPILRMMTRYGNPMLWRGIGTLFYAAGFLILINYPTLMILLVFMTISTVGEDMLSPTTQSIITVIAPGNMRGSYIGVYNLFTSIGSFSGAVLGLWLLYVLRNLTATYWIVIAGGSVAVSFMYISISGIFRKRFSEATVESVKALDS